MKTSSLFLSAICFVTGAFTLRADDLPKRLPFDRYAGMLNRSPFAVASVQAAPAAPPNFAKDLYIANAAHTKDGDLVTLQSAVDRNMKEYLSTKEQNPRGYKIMNIEWSDRPGETKVILSKDGQVATLSFNQALIAQPPPPNSAQPPVPAQPGQVNLPGGYAPKPAVPAPAATPAPHVRGMIQRQPSSAGAIRTPPQMAPNVNPGEKD